MNDLLGKDAVDVVGYLLDKYKVKEFRYRAYIRKTNDAFDEEVVANDLNDLEKIYEKYKAKDPRYLISFQSKVLIPDGYRHFPMLDFSNSTVKGLNLGQVKNLLRQLGETNGFILDSGRCFHYYGNRLMTEDDWVSFMKICAQYPEIGETYISNQLRRGMASLRIVEDDSKPKNPTVIELLN
jgi:hypothetical protein